MSIRDLAAYMSRSPVPQCPNKVFWTLLPRAYAELQVAAVTFVWLGSKMVAGPEKFYNPAALLRTDHGADDRWLTYTIATRPA